MTSKKKWKKIKSWNIGTPEGQTETYSLYEDEESGCFRIQNDFGNVTIDMERMSGHEFLKRVYREVDEKISPGGSDDSWAFATDFDNNDCDPTDFQEKKWVI